jgi:hypothetical protein
VGPGSLELAGGKYLVSVQPRREFDGDDNPEIACGFNGSIFVGDNRHAAIRDEDLKAG